MKFDQTLKDQLKKMPRIEPLSDRETVRQRVLADVENRVHRSKKGRPLLLPTALTAAVVVLLWIGLSPWVMQKADQTGMESSDRSSEGDVISVQSDQSESAPAGNEEAVISDDTEAGEAFPEDEPGMAQEDEDVEWYRSEKEAASEDPDQRRTTVTQARVEYTGTVHKELTIEGMSEKVAFERYLFQPYGLQMLIPLRTDGAKWFDAPQIDAGLNDSVVFESRMEQLENGDLFLSSITVTAHPDRTLSEVKQDEIETEKENAAELGYRIIRREESFANGERLMFIRTLSGTKGESYQYIREVFLTEQSSRTFAFHIGRHEMTSDGWDPRLKSVVYPELKLVKK